jgi:apolipoprotein N-acyltransferase
MFKELRAKDYDAQAIDTTLKTNNLNLLDELYNNRTLLSLAKSSKKSIVLFPELVGGAFKSRLSFIWSSRARLEDKSVIFGVTENVGKKHKNIVALYEDGKLTKLYEQRYPVPFYMYNPLSRGGYLLGEGQVGRSKNEFINNADILICYESLLIMRLIESLFRETKALFLVSSTAWDNFGFVKRREQKVTTLWSQLTRVPVFLANNF